MKALVTGGAGFIGLALSRYLLAKGWSVDLADNFSRGPRDSQLQTAQAHANCRLVESDLMANEAEKGFDSDYDAIFHFAALLGVQNVIDHPRQTLWRNTVLTESALRIAERQKNLSRFVFASTSEIYAGSVGASLAKVPTPESTGLLLTSLNEPRTSYMLSKIVGEALCNFSGLPLTIVRPHNIFGPRMGMSHVVPQLFQRIHAAGPGEELTVFSPTHTRAFCFIDDAVELLFRMIGSKDCAGMALNLGSPGPEISMLDLAHKMVGVAGKSLKVSGARDHQGSPSRRCPDMTLTNRLTGYELRLPLEEALARTYAWYRENVFEK